MYWAIHLIGPSHLWPYLLNAALYAITLYSTFKIAELLFNADIASLTVLLLTLHYGFTRRAQLYNHNSVLVCFIALTVLVTLLALRDDKFGQWALAGLLAGLSLLVKYQAILPLVGILVAIGLNNDFQKMMLPLGELNKVFNKKTGEIITKNYEMLVPIVQQMCIRRLPRRGQNNPFSSADKT